MKSIRRRLTVLGFATLISGILAPVAMISPASATAGGLSVGGTPTAFCSSSGTDTTRCIRESGTGLNAAINDNTFNGPKGNETVQLKQITVTCGSFNTNVVSSAHSCPFSTSAMNTAFNGDPIVTINFTINGRCVGTDGGTAPANTIVQNCSGTSATGTVWILDGTDTLVNKLDSNANNAARYLRASNPGSQMSAQSTHGTTVTQFGTQDGATGTPVAPVVDTQAASGETNTTATLNGTVNPEGQSTTFQFDWGTTTAYGNTAGSGSAGSGSSAVGENTGLTGLTASTTYHYRIEATNATGTTLGVDEQFTTNATATPTDCAATPSSCGYPDATNTGWSGTASTTLVRGTNTSGTGWDWTSNQLNITGASASLSGFDIPGNVVITGANSTLTQSRVAAGSNTDTNGMGIDVNASGVTLTHDTIAGGNNTTQGLDSGIKCHNGDPANCGSLTIETSDISNARSGIQDVAGLVQDNYIHHLRHASGDHVNGITQNGSTQALDIEHNTVFNDTPDQTDAIGLFNDFGAESNVTVNNNFVAGGDYAIYGGDTGGSGGPPANDVITNNRFGQQFFVTSGQFGTVVDTDAPSNGNVDTGNFFDTDLSSAN